MSATIVREPDENDTKPPRRRRSIIIAAVLAVVLLGAATWAVAFSPLFGVRSVEVSGVRHLSVQQVQDAAAISPGEPLVRLDTDAVRARVEALPDVASAAVTTSFPSTVRIAVTERVAVGIVRAGKGFELVDDTGDRFRAVTGRPAHLPLLVISSATPATSAAAVAEVADALPAGLLSRIESIQAMDPSAITVVMRSGKVVRWGDAQRSAFKARILVPLLARPGSSYDLTDPYQPVVRTS